MEQFIQLLSQKYPSILEAKGNILSFVDSLQKKFPFLNEEDLQQLVLMQGVDQGEIPQADYEQMVSGRETPENISRITGQSPSGSKSDFSKIRQLLGKV